jgi:Imm-5 like putative immunity protein
VRPMTEAEWLACAEPLQMFGFVRSRGTLRKEWLLACAGCRVVWTRLPDDRSREAVEVAERFADGKASVEELKTAASKAIAAAVETKSSPTDDSRVNWLVFHATASFSRGAAPAVLAKLSQLGQDGATLLRDIFGNPFRLVTFTPEWRTGTAVALARQMYESRDFSAMPILADALQDAGCDDADILDHCRGPGPHMRGCWLVDAVLNKE